MTVMVPANTQESQRLGLRRCATCCSARGAHHGTRTAWGWLAGLGLRSGSGLTYEHGRLVDKTDPIAERVLGVEGPFAPGSGLDVGIKLFAACAAAARKDSFQIVNGEVDVFWIGGDVVRVTVFPGGVAGEDCTAAIKVVSPSGNALTGLSQNLRVEGRGPVDACHGQYDSIELGGHGSRRVGWT